MTLETEAVPNPDAQRGESASAPSAADTSAPGAAASPNDANREQGTGDREQERSANPEPQIPNPASSANPESPTPAQKPKRKYTMSQKALDSRRTNIKLALAVPKEIRYRRVEQMAIWRLPH
jgi:hypothetical protein